MASTKALSDINSLKGRLQRAQAEIEHFKLQLSGKKDSVRTEGKKEVDELRRLCRQLESRVKVCVDRSSHLMEFYWHDLLWQELDYSLDMYSY